MIFLLGRRYLLLHDSCASSYSPLSLRDKLNVYACWLLALARKTGLFTDVSTGSALLIDAIPLEDVDRDPIIIG